MIIAHLKKYRVVYSYLLTAFFILLFIHYVRNHKEVFFVLSKLSPHYLIGIIVLAVLFKAVVAVKFRIMMRFFGAKLKTYEWLGLSCVSSMMNSILPAHAGLFTQAIYMKRIHQLGYTRFTSYLANFLVFVLTVSSFFAVAFLILYYFLSGKFYAALFIIFSVILALNIAFLLSVPYLSRMNLKIELLNKMVKGFKLFHEHKNLVAQLFMAQVADIVITGGRFFLAYLALGAKVDFLPVLIVGLFASCSIVISLTPANLGIRELFVTVSSVMIGSGAVFGVAVSLIDRVVGTVVTFFFGLVFMYLLLPRKKAGKNPVSL